MGAESFGTQARFGLHTSPSPRPQAAAPNRKKSSLTSYVLNKHETLTVRSQTEHFEILEGTLTLLLGGARKTLRTGEMITIPSGAKHRMWNSGSTPARAIWRTTPAGRTEKWFARIEAVNQREHSDLLDFAVAAQEESENATGDHLQHQSTTAVGSELGDTRNRSHHRTVKRVRSIGCVSVVIATLDRRMSLLFLTCTAIDSHSMRLFPETRSPRADWGS